MEVKKHLAMVLIYISLLLEKLIILPYISKWFDTFFDKCLNAANFFQLSLVFFLSVAFEFFDFFI